MSSPKHLGFADDIDTDVTQFVNPIFLAAPGWRAITESPTGMAETTAVTVAKTVSVAVPAGVSEPQLDGYTYGHTSVYGSNITAAWRYSSGNGVTIPPDPLCVFSMHSSVARGKSRPGDRIT